MNCKPGDLARIVHPSLYGRMVLVIEHAPNDKCFHLPDGRLHESSVTSHWLVESLGWEFDVKEMTHFGKIISRKSKWAAIEGRWLRPIRDPGDEAVDEMLLRIGTPEGVAA